ncbi:NAD(P)-binding domain [Moorella glycerini]|uniref:Uncharacterized protein n=1 Tax=Neomoorella stamsii TaxID=1266720 RepID=A0A9X7J5Z7_9FIRM|nr:MULTISPECIES: hypothetical protein [Moorella]PRR77544.1 hypothetical protein MOST_01410 [Moorella stamsii]CEP69409.1 NAD(P)-binding domain [Moorella glycerini]
MPTKLGVGVLGYGFMGKAHTNAFIKISYIFYPFPAEPELVTICGRNEANVRDAAALVILGDRKYIVAPKNEIERFLEEQVPDLGFEPWTYEWYESREEAIAQLAGNRKIGSDIPMGGWPVLGADLNRLRYSLTDEEIARARDIGAMLVAASIRIIKAYLADLIASALFKKSSSLRAA